MPFVVASLMAPRPRHARGVRRCLRRFRSRVRPRGPDRNCSDFTRSVLRATGVIGPDGRNARPACPPRPRSRRPAGRSRERAVPGRVPWSRVLAGVRRRHPTPATDRCRDAAARYLLGLAAYWCRAVRRSASTLWPSDRRFRVRPRLTASSETKPRQARLPHGKNDPSDGSATPHTASGVGYHATGVAAPVSGDTDESNLLVVLLPVVATEEGVERHRPAGALRLEPTPK